MEANKYFIYARKSTKGDKKQTLSINSQVKALNKLIQDQRLKVVGKFTERQTAHVPGRPVFGDMLKRIERGEANGIIAWHPDRLARNSKDGGEIIYLLDENKLVDLKFCTFWFENTPQGKSMLGHAFVDTKQYSDKLSFETRRGLHDKADAGYCPGVAPRGYLNDKATKTMVPDPHLAPIIREVFEFYATGDYSIERIQEFLTEKGVLTRKCGRWGKGGNRICQNRVRRILTNSFYFGPYEYAGEIREGKHQPIITKALFDRVQRVMQRRGHTYPAKQEPKVFTGLLTCEECGCAITAEVHKGKVYYRCTKKGRKCFQPYLREEALSQELSCLLRPYALPKEWAKAMLTMAEAEQSDLVTTRQTMLDLKQDELVKVQGSLDHLLKVYLLRDIDRETFLREKAGLVEQKLSLQAAIDRMDEHHDGWLEQLKEWIKTAQTMGEIATTGSPQEKKQALLKVFGSNLVLGGKKARGCALKPWLFLSENHVSQGLVPLYRLARNHFLQGSAETPALPTVGNPSEEALAA